MTEKITEENPLVGKGCGNHDCVIDPPKGMGTNATCRCPDWKLRGFISWLKGEKGKVESERNALQTEVERQRPVMEAAIELRESGSLDSDYQPDVRLMITVDAFKKSVD